jgi:hypothetical protein
MKLVMYAWTACGEELRQSIPSRKSRCCSVMDNLWDRKLHFADLSNSPLDESVQRFVSCSPPVAIKLSDIASAILSDVWWKIYS